MVETILKLDVPQNCPPHCFPRRVCDQSFLPKLVLAQCTPQQWQLREDRISSKLIYPPESCSAALWLLDAGAVNPSGLGSAPVQVLILSWGMRGWRAARAGRGCMGCAATASRAATKCPELFASYNI